MQLHGNLFLVGVFHLQQGIVQLQSQGFGDVGGHGIGGALNVQRHAPAEVGLRIEQTAQQTRVGDGGFLAATAKAGRSGHSAHTVRPDGDVVVHNAKDRTPAGTGTHDFAHGNGHADSLHVTAPHLGHRAVEVLTDVGRGAAHVDGHAVGESIQPGECLDTFHATARTRTVGVDRHRLGHAGGVTVVAKDQQRVLGPVLTQPALCIEQEGLHGGVQEGIDHRRPSAPHDILVSRQVAPVQDGDGPQQVPWVLAQSDLLETVFHRQEVVTTEAHHQPVSAGGREVVDRLHHVHLGGIAHHGRRVQEHHTVAHQHIEHLRIVLGQAHRQVSRLGIDDQT